MFASPASNETRVAAAPKCARAQEKRKLKKAPLLPSPPSTLTKIARHRQHPEHGPRHGLFLLLRQGRARSVELGGLLVAPRRLGRVPCCPRSIVGPLGRARQRLELRPKHLLEGARSGQVGEPRDEVLLDRGVLAEDFPD